MTMGCSTCSRKFPFVDLVLGYGDVPISNLNFSILSQQLMLDMSLLKREVYSVSQALSPLEYYEMVNSHGGYNLRPLFLRELD